MPNHQLVSESIMNTKVGRFQQQVGKHWQQVAKHEQQVVAQQVNPGRYSDVNNATSGRGTRWSGEGADVNITSHGSFLGIPCSFSYEEMVVGKGWKMFIVHAVLLYKM